MNSSPISWMSRKQTLITNSTMASEAVAAYTGLQKLREPMELLREMGFKIDRPPLFCDNSAVLQHIIDHAPQPGFGTKHLALYTKILREACTRFHDIHPFYVDTDVNPADIFTKSTIKGTDSQIRWENLEAKIRGFSDTEWIKDLIKAKRKNENNRSTLSMEITSNIRSPDDYLNQTGWDTISTAFVATGIEHCDELESAMNCGTLPRDFKGLEIFCGENSSARTAVRKLYRGCKKCKVDFKTLDNNCEKCKPNFCVDIETWGTLLSITSRENLTSYGFQFPVWSIHKRSLLGPEISRPQIVWRLPRSALLSNLKLKFL
jgi:hypothetical protein